MTDYTALGGSEPYQDGGYTPTYGTSGGGYVADMVKTLSTWTAENATRQQIEDYENGRITEEEYD